MDQKKNQGQQYKRRQPSGERGAGSNLGERNRSSEGSSESESSSTSGSSGISNRGTDRDLSEQDQLPERGSSQSER